VIARGRRRAALPLASALLATLLALLATGLSGCAMRERSNPLDPKNRVTRGMLTGFNAIAGDGVVGLRWPLLTQEGVTGYRIDRWLPGEDPRPLPGASYSSHVAAAEDLTARNDSTYLYRLVASFQTGDSAVSPPDTATPGTRRTLVLVANLPGVVGLAPDGRDVLFANGVEEPYDDLELDSTRGLFWLRQYELGRIVSRRFEGSATGSGLTLTHPTDLAVATTQRGTVWVALPDEQRVARFEPLLDSLRTPITGVGPARIVESNSAHGTLWIGADDGGLYQASVATTDTLQSWRLEARVTSIAVDHAIDVAWVATRSGDLCDLYRVVPGQPTPEHVRTGLLNVTDLEVEPIDRTLWVCERGAPLRGNGRLSRLGRDGQPLATLTGMEPYALAIEPGTRACWVTDVKSDRLLEISADGAVLRRSPPLGVPYGVRVYRP
jgi:DNA-binding beta-propeller fold protein YncE